MTTSLRTPARLNLNLILLLVGIGLIRPVLGAMGLLRAYAPALPVAVILLVAVVWIAVVVAIREPRPVATLALSGAVYGLVEFAIGQATGAGAVYGPLEVALGGAATVGFAFALLAVVLTNAAGGALAGLVAAALGRGRRRP
jgi:hypothetical protein